MTRLYKNFLTNVYTREAESLAMPEHGLACVNEACDVTIQRGEPVWRVAANRSDGWVIRHGEVHPACGESMRLVSSRERNEMEWAAYHRRTGQ